MKLKKITAYIQIDKQEDTITTIIPSGFRGSYIIVEEDPAYNLGVAYFPFEKSKELLKALKAIRRAKKK